MSSIQTFENVDGTGNASSSQIVGQADPRVSHLVGMLPPQLKNGLVDLPNPGRTDRVPFREQPSAGVDGAVAPYPRSSLRRVPAALPTRYDAKILGIDDLGDREAVVQLDEVDV